MKEYFKDEKGNLSMMRANSFIALCMASYLSLMPNTDINILMIWLVAAFAPKAVQKFAEK